MFFCGRFLPIEGGGVYSSRWCYGSPAHKYSLWCTNWIVEVGRLCFREGALSDANQFSPKNMVEVNLATNQGYKDPGERASCRFCQQSFINFVSELNFTRVRYLHLQVSRLTPCDALVSIPNLKRLRRGGLGSDFIPKHIFLLGATPQLQSAIILASSVKHCFCSGKLHFTRPKLAVLFSSFLPRHEKERKIH